MVTGTKGRQIDNIVVTGGTVSCQMTTYGVSSDDNIVSLTNFCFQWCNKIVNMNRAHILWDKYSRETYSERNG